MKRVLDANDDDTENTETPTSPKRYISLQSSTVLDGEVQESDRIDFFTFRDLQGPVSETGTISSNAATTDCTANEAMSEIFGVSATNHDNDKNGHDEAHDLVIGGNGIHPTDEAVPADYGAEEQVPSQSTPDLPNSEVLFANDTEDTQENFSEPTPQRMPTQSKFSACTSQRPDKFVPLKPKHDKKTIIVQKPVRSNVGELGNTSLLLKKNFENDCCIIQTLMKRQFTQKSWSDAERVEIISNGPPQPFITRINVGPSEYKRFPWLAGCVDGAKAYCWYCLLFSSVGVWSTSVIHRALLQAANKHNTSGPHVEAHMLLRHWNSKMSLGLFRGVRDNTEISDSGAEKNTRNELFNARRETPTDSSNSDTGCLIVRLLRKNFLHGTWVEKDRENIIEKGRPTPKMETMLATQLIMKQPCPRNYIKSQFLRIPWLTASEELNKLFCWPCVLFCPHGAWAKVGYSNLNVLTLGVHRHEITQPHLEACLRLKVWEQQVRKKSVIRNVPYEKHNEAVKRSREFMKYVVDVICYFKKKTENTNVSYANVMKLITKISSHDAKLKHYLRTRSLFEDEISGITKSVEACLKQRIYKEANKANFVSVILNGVCNKPWVSVVLRYVMDNGEVHERFLQFIEFKYDTVMDSGIDNERLLQIIKLKNSAPINNLLEKVIGVIDFLDNKTELVGFTHDDSAIKPSDLAYFNTRITEKYPAAHFFHCKDHNLKVLMLQSLSQLRHCRNFIHGIQDLVTFFERNPIAKTSLTIIHQEISTEVENWEYVWNFRSGIIKTINDHYPAMIKLFERMIRSAVAWNTETVAEAHNFLTFLQPLDNRFLIATLSRILYDIHDLSRTMETRFDANVWKKVAEKTSEAIIKSRCDDFEVIFQSAWNMLPSDKEYAYDLAYAEKFDEIMESASLFIHCRTKDLENWAYMELMTNPLLDVPSKSSTFNKYVAVLKRRFPYAGFEKLSTQLTFFQGNAIFRGKKIDELIKYIHDLDMIHALPALHKFAQLMLTVSLYPFSTSKIPAVDRITSYTDNRKGFTSTDALMFVEKDLLTELQKEPDFYENVISNFADHFGGDHLKFQKSTDEVKW